MSRAKPARKPNDGTISNTERSVLPNRMSSMHPRQERPHGKRYYEKNKEAAEGTDAGVQSATGSQRTPEGSYRRSIVSALRSVPASIWI